MELIEQLVKLGFGKKKAEVYCALLNVDSCSAAELAVLANVKRPTAYDLLGELVEEGLAVVSFEGSKRQYSATPPHNLQHRLQRQVEILDETLPELNALYHRNSQKPRIRYYKGAGGVQQFHNELLQTSSGEYCYFGSMQGLLDVVGARYLKSYVRRRIEKKIWSNSIRIREQEVDEEFLLAGDEKYRRVRYISMPEIDKAVNLMLFDDKIAIISTTQENYVLIVESHELYTMMKIIWDYLWKTAKA